MCANGGGGEEEEEEGVSDTFICVAFQKPILVIYSESA